jgi:hypothetical protein
MEQIFQKLLQTISRASNPSGELLHSQHYEVNLPDIIENSIIILTNLSYRMSSMSYSTLLSYISVIIYLLRVFLTVHTSNSILRNHPVFENIVKIVENMQIFVQRLKIKSIQDCQSSDDQLILAIPPMISTLIQLEPYMKSATDASDVTALSSQPVVESTSIPSVSEAATTITASTKEIGTEKSNNNSNTAWSFIINSNKEDKNYQFSSDKKTVRKLQKKSQDDQNFIETNCILFNGRNTTSSAAVSTEVDSNEIIFKIRNISNEQNISIGFSTSLNFHHYELNSFPIGIYYLTQTNENDLFFTQPDFNSDVFAIIKSSPPSDTEFIVDEISTDNQSNVWGRCHLMTVKHIQQYFVDPTKTSDLSLECE